MTATHDETRTPVQVGRRHGDVLLKEIDLDAREITNMLIDHGQRLTALERDQLAGTANHQRLYESMEKLGGRIDHLAEKYERMSNLLASMRPLERVAWIVVTGALGVLWWRA